MFDDDDDKGAEPMTDAEARHQAHSDFDSTCKLCFEARGCDSCEGDEAAVKVSVTTVEGILLNIVKLCRSCAKVRWTLDELEKL